jgi:hypothetical protein
MTQPAPPPGWEDPDRIMASIEYRDRRRSDDASHTYVPASLGDYLHDDSWRLAEAVIGSPYAVRAGLIVRAPDFTPVELSDAPLRIRGL